MAGSIDSVCLATGKGFMDFVFLLLLAGLAATTWGLVVVCTRVSKGRS
jgi:hypothetical protein